MDLNDLSSPWFSLLQRMKKGQRVEKADIVALLRSEHAVVEEAKSLLADVLEGKHQFKKGNKPNKHIPTTFFGKHSLALFVKEIKWQLESGQSDIDPKSYIWLNSFKDESGRRIADAVDGERGSLTSREGAEMIAAQMLSVSVRVIQEIKKTSKGFSK